MQSHYPDGAHSTPSVKAVEARIAKARQDGRGPRDRPGSRRGGRPPLPLQDEKGRYSTRGLVEKYGVTWHIVRHWIDTGVVTPERDHPTAHLRFWITKAVEKRIQAALERGSGPRRQKQPDHRPLAGAKISRSADARLGKPIGR